MAEVISGNNKVIIGMDIVNSLFDEKPEKAVNKIISVGNIKYKVVGILKSKGSSLNSNEDRVIFAPLLNVKRYYGSLKRNYNISVAAFKPEDMEAAEAVTIGTFRNVRGLKASQENDFEIFKSDSFISILKENTVKFRWAAPAGFVAEGAGEPCLAGAGWADDQQIMPGSDPAAVGEAEEQGLVEAAWGAEVDVLDRGLEA